MVRKPGAAKPDKGKPELRWLLSPAGPHELLFEVSTGPEAKLTPEAKDALERALKAFELEAPSPVPQAVRGECNLCERKMSGVSACETDLSG